MKVRFNQHLNSSFSYPIEVDPYACSRSPCMEPTSYILLTIIYALENSLNRIISCDFRDNFYLKLSTSTPLLPKLQAFMQPNSETTTQATQAITCNTV